MNTKQNNIHKAHPTECRICGRTLPKRAWRPVCAACRKDPLGSFERRNGFPYGFTEHQWKAYQLQEGGAA